MTTSVVVKALRYIAEYRGPVAVTPQTAGDVRAGVEDMGSALYWLKTFLHDKILGEEQRVIGRSGDQLEITGHGIPSNAAVRIFPSPVGTTYAGTIPTPLAENTVYYVRSVDADHIELSASSGPGAAVALTGGIAGDVWVQEVTDWVANLLVTNTTYGSGLLKDLVVWLAGTQTITGAKTFADLTMSGTNKVKLASRSMTRVVGGNGVVNNGVGTSLPTSGAAVAIDDPVIIPLDPPDGAIISAYRVWVAPAAHAALPGTMPVVTLVTTDVDGDQAGPATVTDTSADAAAYSLEHAIEKTGIAVTVDRSLYRYHLAFVQESGANGVAGDVVGASYDFSVTSYDHGAG